MNKIIDKDIWKEYISCYTSKNYSKLLELIRILVAIKFSTIDYEERVKTTTRKVVKKDLGIDIPHTASYKYILRYIDTPQLFEIINDSIRKIEKRNLDLKGKLPTFDFSILGVSVNLLSRVIVDLNQIDSDDAIALLSDIEEAIHKQKEMENKRFEENRTIVFKGDIPISINSSRIYDNTFILEQWMRRILLFIMMSIKGSYWLDYFTNDKQKRYKKSRSWLEGSGLYEFNNDNILWYRDIHELVEFIIKEEFGEFLKDLIGMEPVKLSEALRNFKTIRNEVAHNRTISIEVEKEFDTSLSIVEKAIERFKYKTIYNEEYEILNRGDINTIKKDSLLIKYFHNKYDESLIKHKWNLHAFIGDNLYCYSLVQLPCSGFNHKHIDIHKLLSLYKEFSNYIIAFYIDKDISGYQVILPKNIKDHIDSYRKIMDVFFDVASLIGTDTPYEHQESIYTCNPKIWFYEGYREKGVNNVFNSGETI